MSTASIQDETQTDDPQERQEAAEYHEQQKQISQEESTELQPEPVLDKQQAAEPPYPLPNIFICGRSGSGKSYSVKNLPPEQTALINVERRVLPFKGAARFNRQRYIYNLESFYIAYDKAKKAPDIKYIVIDSFTSFCELVYAATVQVAKDTGGDTRGQWDVFKSNIHTFLLNTKDPDHCCIFMGHEEMVQDDELRTYKTISIQGGLKGKVEKEFDLVLFTNVSSNSSDELATYFFQTNSDGTNTAKSPEGMFESRLVPNDLALVMSKYHEYQTGETEQ